MLEQYIQAIEENNIVSKTDINGIITFVNDEFCKISKYSREELIGKNHNIVRHPNVPKETFKKLWDTILSKKIYKATVKNLAKDGSVFYVNTTVIPILNERDEILEFIAIRYDVTKAVEDANKLLEKEQELENLNLTLEERIKKQTEQLKKLNTNLEERIKKEVEKNREKDRIMFQQARFASMGEMIGNIAHQWRQPLSELDILLFNLKKAFFVQNDKNKFKIYYRSSQKVIQRMSQTIDDFRNFFKQNKEKSQIDVQKLIKEAILIIKETFKSNDIKIIFNIKNSIIINGHKNELLQVILNILNNAKDALVLNKTNDKKIFIDIKKEKFVKIIICDNGGGIKKDIIDRIFDPYFTTKHSSQGTGIGLYMSKKIIEQNGGSIDVYNNCDGACFEIKL